MSARKRVQVTSTRGVWLLGVTLLRLVWLPAPATILPGAVRLRRAPVPGSASEVALQAARRVWWQAETATVQERYPMEAWDPEGTAGLNQGAWRQELMATVHRAELVQARKAARSAAVLARAPVEAYQAALLRARIECDLGNHEAELQQARRLVDLAPRNSLSLLYLQHAARCTGKERVPSPSGGTAGSAPEPATVSQPAERVHGQPAQGEGNVSPH